MHMAFLYEHLREEDAEARAFLDEQQRLRRTWGKELGVSAEEAGRAYALMQWADRFSLVLCRRELPDGERKLEVGQGPDGTAYSVRQRANGSVSVDPWPFTETEIELDVDAHYLTALSFASVDAFRKAVESAPVKALTWELRK